MLLLSYKFLQVKQTFLIIVLAVSSFAAIAQTSIPITIDTQNRMRDVTITSNSDGSYHVKTTGKNPAVSFKSIATNYNYKKLYNLSFDYKVQSDVRGMKVYFDSTINLQPAETGVLKPADTFSTVTFHLHESIDWKKPFKELRMTLGFKENKSIIIKNIRLHEPTWQEFKDEPVYIDNGIVRLGVDLTGGGSVFYFAESKTWRNLLNHADKGRYVQQSYYGRKDSSMWGAKPWAWNPVQGGGSEESGGFSAKVLDKKVTKHSIYIKSLPKHWATGADINDATMEEQITLKGNMAHIVYTFRYNGTIVHPERSQELPAVFVDYALPNLVFYRGNKPWQKDTLSSVVPGWPNQPQKMNEHWAAYVDDKQWGIGIFVPGTSAMTTYRHQGDLLTGPYAGACSYLAPVRKFSIKPGSVFQYDVYLTIDKVDNMREAFNKMKQYDQH